MEYKVGIEPDRVGVLIGKKGEVKRRIEEATNTKIEVNSKSGVVTIKGESLSDVLAVLLCHQKIYWL